MGSSISTSQPTQEQPAKVSPTPADLTGDSSTQSSSDVEPSGGCPMKRSDGSYSYNLSSIWNRDFPHGPGGSKPLDARRVSQSMKLDENDAPRRSECPHREYNVYSQPIDPSNQMPAANQLPAPQQSKLLSTDRVVSTIPKGGADDGKTWTYPSPQMFFNALARKGKLEDTKEEDMENVVAMHNNMNEKTWRSILEWESVAGYNNAKLLKFQGRPTDLSPKAAFKSNVLGHPLPFDRHDWIILRDDNTTIRYVIDYYYDETRARDTPDSANPPLTDENATSSLLVDVRPALDGPKQLYQRVIAMPVARHFLSSTSFTPLPMFPTPSMKLQVGESKHVWQQIQSASSREYPAIVPSEITEAQARELVSKYSTVQSNCALQEKRLSECTDNCDKASLDWTLCASPVLCHVQDNTFRTALQSESDDTITAALASVSACVEWQSAQHKIAKDKYPDLFQKKV